MIEKTKWTPDQLERLKRLATALQESFGQVYVDTVHGAFPARTRRSIREKLISLGFIVQTSYKTGDEVFSEVRDMRCKRYPDGNPILHKNGIMVNYMKPPQMIVVVK